MEVETPPVPPVMPHWVPEVEGMPRPKFLTLMELKDRGQCRWPYGNSDFLFCGLPSDIHTYCQWHRGMNYRRGAW